MSSRGKHILYNAIVPLTSPSFGKKSKRDSSLNAFRDKLAYRYYFHAVICRKRYDDCLNELFYEFDKQPDTIVKHLQERLDLIKELTSSKTTTSTLRRKYPFYNWLAKAI